MRTKWREKSAYFVSSFRRDTDFVKGGSKCGLREDEIRITDNVEGATFRMELSFTSHFPWITPSLEFRGRSTERGLKKTRRRQNL